MKVFVILLVLIGLFTSSAFAFEPSSTNYFSNPEFKIYKVQENSYEFSIPYKISDAKLDIIVVDCDSTALIIYLDAVDTEGDLIINIPRALLDAKIGEQDDALFFILDQQEIEPQEINTDSDSRTFDIPLQTDGELLEIIASSVGMFPEPIPCGVGGADKSPYYRLLSPLKQFNSGIPFDEIQCKQNLVLLQKYDGSPACVKPETEWKLIERGWTTVDFSEEKIKVEKINGAQILGFSFDDENKSIIVSIDSSSEGYITITIPRNVLDSKVQGEDDDFFILVDGKEIDFKETKNNTTRTFTIPFESGAKEIEITIPILI